jgi:hypothetical protein
MVANDGRENLGEDAMTLAPIVLFVYRRPGHTQRLLTSLANCDLARQSELIVYSDGPRDDSDIERVSEVRRIVQSEPWCGTVSLVRRETNQGLARSVIAGVSEQCARCGKVIVLEDDLRLHPAFLTFMNRTLEAYADHDEVMQVAGHMFAATFEIDPALLFLPFVSTWGWGTWQRAWRHFDVEAKGSAEVLARRDIRRLFDLQGAYPYSRMLDLQLRGKIDSWGILWNLSVFMRHGLVAYPGQTLVINDGFDGSGRHCGVRAGEEVQWSAHAGELPDRWPAPEVDPTGYAAVRRALAGEQQSGGRVARFLKTWRYRFLRIKGREV